MAVLEYYLTGYRRVWRGTVFTSFLLPVLFFLGMGIAVGAYVDRGGALDLPYAEFIAPGLVAFSGLQIAMTESGFPVLGAFKWRRVYYGIAAAPPRVGDIIIGQLGYISLRVAVGATAFLIVMVPFGVVRSGWSVLMPPIAILVGLAVATPMFAYSATVDSPNQVAIMFRFGLLPMMLFSGVFFPISQLPEVIQPVAYLTPLWHGVELCRSAALGLDSSAPVLVHVGYLALWVVVGYLLASARFRVRLAR